MSTVLIIENVIGQMSECLTPESAQRILEIQADETTQKKVAHFAELTNFGTISQDQKEEYQDLLRVFNLLGIFQAKARRFLMTTA